ncbi:MAG TPA: type II toxin-antitoxin system VapC family toxin [Candidatus Binatia bacterium]|nr:type II toxin-antitoxin system VapC family toxin [Candidatus Binatia bacterium]
MSLAYFDTSVLVKNYVQEGGSAQARQLLAAYEFLSSAIAPIELHSAVQRRYRQGDITRANYNAIIARVKTDRSSWQLVESVPQVLAKAEEAVVKHQVRTLDAIHLASALIIQQSVHTPLQFISADERQLAAARSCKLQTIAII